MSTEAVLAQEPIRKWTRAEYERLAEMGVFADERVELLEGVITPMSPHGKDHQWSIEAATEHLVLKFHGRARVRVQLPIGVRDDSEPEPDFSVIAIRSGVQKTPTEAFLVIEVADSTVRRDREIKAPLYAQAGVPEYWLVDVQRDVVEVRTVPIKGEYTRLETFGREAKVRPAAFPDLEIELQYLLPPRSQG